jgi:hypothetical protein
MSRLREAPVRRLCPSRSAQGQLFFQRSLVIEGEDAEVSSDVEALGIGHWRFQA